jgi:hypothetical protein
MFPALFDGLQCIKDAFMARHETASSKSIKPQFNPL